MRITTHMLNQTAMKAGLPLMRQSLLDYVNNDDSQVSLSASSQMNQIMNQFHKNTYEKTEDSSGRMMDAALQLQSDKTDSLFEKAKDGGDTKEVTAVIEKMVSAYNDTLKNMSASTETLDQFYLQQLKEAAVSRSEDLKKIGISVEKNGMLKVNQKTLQSAELSDLEGLFGNGGGFSEKVGYLGYKIAQNASSVVSSLANGYTSKAAESSSYRTAGNFNFLG